MDICEALKEWRKQNDLSQEDAASQLGESVRSLQEWEQGRRIPSGRALERIYEHLAPILNSGTEIQSHGTSSFAQRLRNYRKITRQNREEAARSLGVSVGMIQDAEQERRVPRGETIIRLLPFFRRAEEQFAANERQLEASPILRILARRNLGIGRPKVDRDPGMRLERARGEVSRWGEAIEKRFWNHGGSTKAFYETELAKAERELQRALSAQSRANARIEKESARRGRTAPRRKSPIL